MTTDDQTPRSDGAGRWDAAGKVATGASEYVAAEPRNREHAEDDADGDHSWWRCTPITTAVEAAGHGYLLLASQPVPAVEGLRAEGTSIEDIQARLNGGYVGFKVPVMMAAADVSSLLAVIRRLAASQPSRDEGPTLGRTAEDKER